MRCFLLFAAVLVPWVAAFAFNTYDLGFQGLYPRQRFHSVDFEAPAPKITQWNSRCDSGNLLLTPRGPLVTGPARGPVMLDARGNLIWMDTDRFEQVLNLNVQKYKGEDYLAFWTKGKNNSHPKHARKSYVLLNSSYEVSHRVYPHGIGHKADSHEFRITPQGTALITIYYRHKVDCISLGLGSGKSCWIKDGLFQEIDIETGDLVFEWRATNHIHMSDLFSSPSHKDGHGKSQRDAFDFFHINSVDKIDSGDYIISARYMHAIVCISAKTGDILWQVGGKNNSFEDLNGATDFAWQHHATWQGNNTISLFDNHANSVFHSPYKHSKGMLIHLDREKMTARLLQKYVHPDEILNVSQGSVQVIPESGNVLVGFGNSPTFVEFSAAGEVLCSAHFGPHLIFEIVDLGLAKSYRVFKSPWVGRPRTVPDVKVEGGKIYVSWNGATEVTGWRLETAKTQKAKDDEFVTVRELERDGFETSFALEKVDKYVRIVALDAAKSVMAYSPVVKTSSPSAISRWSILFFIIGFAGLLFLYREFRRLPRFPRLVRLLRLPKLSDPRGRSYTAAMGNQECDAEIAPLLLNERDP